MRIINSQNFFILDTIARSDFIPLGGHWQQESTQRMAFLYTKPYWAASTAGSAGVFYAGIVGRRHTPIVGDGTLLKTPQRQKESNG
jgi:hypothetical protein